MTKQQIDEAIKASGARMSKGMKWAIEGVLLRSMTWRDASIKYGVTESGMLKAMRRIGLR